MKRLTILQSLTALLLVLAFVLPVCGQQVSVQADGRQVAAFITHLAKNSTHGRKPMTPEIQELQQWAADNFKAWGLEPGGENGTYFQAVPLGQRGSYIQSIGIPRLILGGREFFSRYGDFTLDDHSTPGVKIKADVVFAGYGICAPEKGLDEWAGLDVKGKLVLVLKGSPSGATLPRMSFGPTVPEVTGDENEWTKEAADTAKIKIALEKGAAGIIFFDPSTISGTTTTSRFFRRRSSMNISFDRNFIYISAVDYRVIKWLFWRDDQESSRAFERRLAWLAWDIRNKKPQSFDTGVKAQVTSYERTEVYGEEVGKSSGRNVIAKISGTDPVLKNEYIVLGGHFDHLGTRQGLIYNGADDNASGSATVLAVAQLFKKTGIQPKRTIYFCLWTGEELGLIGSNYWGEHPTDGVSMDRVVTNFNMDMVALGDTLDAPGALNFPFIWNIIKRNQRDDVISVVTPHTAGPGGSDYSAFISRGIEALALMTAGGGGHPDYHDTGDDPEKSEPDILGKTAQFVLQGTVNVANEPGSLIIPDRQLKYDAMRWSPALINPSLTMSGAWTKLEAKNPAELTDLVLKKIEELRQPADQQTSMMRRFRFFMRGGNYTTGIEGPGAYGGDANLLKVAKDALSFGRVDVCSCNKLWFDNGLTPAGEAGIKSLEENSLTLALYNPSSAILDGVLQLVTKPIIVVGAADLTDGQIAALNEKDALVAVDFDPADIQACLDKLTVLKGRFGDVDNLILYVKSDKGLEKAKKDLFMKLHGLGWSTNDINAIAGIGESRRSQGNLDKLRGQVQDFFGRRRSN